MQQPQCTLVKIATFGRERERTSRTGEKRKAQLLLQPLNTLANGGRRYGGVPMRQVIEVIGRALNVPVVSITKEEAGDYYGPLAMFAGLGMPASSALTQQRLGLDAH
jgi:hypothetical protein